MQFGDWSSDVCSSDLVLRLPPRLPTFPGLSKRIMCPRSRAPCRMAFTGERTQPTPVEGVRSVGFPKRLSGLCGLLSGEAFGGQERCLEVSPYVVRASDLGGVEGNSRQCTTLPDSRAGPDYIYEDIERWEVDIITSLFFFCFLYLHEDFQDLCTL